MSDSPDPAPAPPGGPLAGIRIVDLSIALTGPYAVALLGDQGAKVVKVSNASSSSAGESSGAASSPGSSESRPAPPTVLNKLKSVKGKSYEEKSKELPNVVETG